MRKGILIGFMLSVALPALAEEPKVYTDSDLKGYSSSNSQYDASTIEREKQRQIDEESKAYEMAEKAKEKREQEAINKKERQAKRERAQKNIDDTIDRMNRREQSNKIDDMDRKLDRIDQRLRGY